MSRYVTEDQLDKIIEKATKRTLMAFLSEADKPKQTTKVVKPKGKPKAEKFAGEAELVEALKVHYGGDFEDSELALASYEEFDKANLRSLMLTWGIQNKQPSVEAFVGNKKSSFLRKTWWNGFKFVK